MIYGVRSMIIIQEIFIHCKCSWPETKGLYAFIDHVRTSYHASMAELDLTFVRLLRNFESLGLPMDPDHQRLRIIEAGFNSVVDGVSLMSILVKQNWSGSSLI